MLTGSSDAKPAEGDGVTENETSASMSAPSGIRTSGTSGVSTTGVPNITRKLPALPDLLETAEQDEEPGAATQRGHQNQVGRDGVGLGVSWGEASSASTAHGSGSMEMIAHTVQTLDSRLHTLESAVSGMHGQLRAVHELLQKQSEMLAESVCKVPRKSTNQ